MEDEHGENPGAADLQGLPPPSPGAELHAGIEDDELEAAGGPSGAGVEKVGSEGGEGDEAAGEGEGDEGEEGSSVQDSSEEDDDDDGNEYEDDGFVVDEDDEDEGGEAEAGPGGAIKKRKGKKKRRARALEMDEEDYNLLEEQGVRVQRPTGRKRLKRAEDGGRGGPDRDAAALRDELFGNEDLEDMLEEDDEDDEGGGPRSARDRPGSGGGSRGAGAQGREQGRGDGRRGDRGGAPGRSEEEGLSDLLDDDEMGDFIVDEGPGGAARARRRRQALSAAIPGISAAALEEAADIFGDVEELLNVYQARRREPGVLVDDQPTDEPDEGEGLEDDGDAAERRAAAAEAALLRRAMRLLDAETLASQHLLPADQAIRAADLPERFQLLGVRLDEQEPVDLEACADWIYWALFVAQPHEGGCGRAAARIVEAGLLEVDGGSPAPVPPDGWPRSRLVSAEGDAPGGGYSPMRVDGVRDQGSVLRLGSRRALRRARSEREVDTWRVDSEAQDALKAAIKQALVHMYERGEEPCLLGLYRKDVLGELLALREEDAPAVTSQAEADERADALRNDPVRAAAFPPQTIQPRHRRIRRFDALWAVLWLSLRFQKLWRRRGKLLSKLDAMMQALAEGAYRDKAGDLEALRDWAVAELAGPAPLPTVNPETALTETVLDDLDAYLRSVQECLGLEPELTALSLEDGGSQAGVEGLMRAPLISASELAQNVEDPDTHKYQAEEPDEPHTHPAEWLGTQVAVLPLETHGLSPDPTDLLMRVKAMAAHDISTEPRIRAWLRGFFDGHAVVSTSPTLAGMDHPMMEPYARYGRVKHYREKPIASFAGTDAFLRIVEASREKLLTYTLALPPRHHEELLAQFKRLYQSTNKSLKAQAWNELRGEIVGDALSSRLLPLATAEARQRLLTAAREVAMDEYSSALWQLARMAPLRLRLPEEGPNGEVFLDAPRIMAATWGPGGAQPTVVVVLNEHGGLVDLLPCGQLSGVIPRTMRGQGAQGPGSAGWADAISDPRKAGDMNRLLDKIKERRPHALVVGMSDPSAGQLHVDLVALMDHLLDVHPRFVQQLETGNIELLPVDERVAALWQDCKAAKEEFPEQPPHIRRAIGLGRLQLAPLAVLAALCGPRAELLALPITELQGALQETDRLRAVEQVMVTATAQVGVNVNLVANVGWHRHVLQFVPGLGPRKAQALLQAVARNNNRVESRTFMYKDMSDVMGRTVFRNCSPSLLLSSAGLPALANLELRVMDETRIHPESYRLAVALCHKATGEDDVEAAVDEHRDQVEVLDLVEFAEAREPPVKLCTVIDVHMELLAPGGELRPPSKPLTDKECYLLQHGESDSSLCRGRLVEARVVFVGRDEVKARLTHGAMDAVIARENLSSNADWLMGDLRDKIRKDQVLTCRVMGVVDYVRPGSSAKQIVVELSSRGDDMDPAKWEELYCRELPGEAFYHVQTAAERAEAAARLERALRPATPTRPNTPTRAAKEGGRSEAAALVRRPIQHPRYKDMTSKDAVLWLGDKPIGSALVRPTIRRTGLALSVKVHDPPAAMGLPPCIMHFKVVEATPKPGAGLGLSAPLRVDLTHAGQKLEDAAEYEDLDELLAAFVEPLVLQVAEIIKHRKFADGRRTDISSRITAEFAAGGGKTWPYCLGLGPPTNSTAEGVSFYIAFALPSKRSDAVAVHHDYFWPTPTGFLFRKTPYTNLERMIAAFKKAPVAPGRKVQHESDDAALGYRAPDTIPTNMDIARPGGYGAASSASGYGAAQARGSGYGLPPGGNVPYGGFMPPAPSQPVQGGGYGAPPAAGPPPPVVSGYGGGGVGWGGAPHHLPGPPRPGGGSGYGLPPPPPPGGPPGGYGALPPPPAMAPARVSKWDRGAGLPPPGVPSYPPPPPGGNTTRGPGGYGGV